MEYKLLDTQILYLAYTRAIIVCLTWLVMSCAEFKENQKAA